MPCRYLELASIVLDVIIKQLLGIVTAHDINAGCLDAHDAGERHEVGCLCGPKDQVGDIHQLP